MDIELFERLINKIKKVSSGCWEWQGSLSDGYGQFSYNDKVIKAYRFMYEYFIGIPEGTECLDHLCRNRKCVNPKHLNPTTFKDNQLRGYGISGINSRKKECKHGHKLSGDNLFIKIRKGIASRACRECRKSERIKQSKKIACKTIP